MKTTFLELCDDTSEYVNSFDSDMMRPDVEEGMKGGLMARKELCILGLLCCCFDNKK